MLHPTMLDDVGPTMLASFEQTFKEDNAWLYDSNEFYRANLVWHMSRLQKAGVVHKT